MSKIMKGWQLADKPEPLIEPTSVPPVPVSVKVGRLQVLVLHRMRPFGAQDFPVDSDNKIEGKSVLPASKEEPMPTWVLIK
jgi:hypothetical protein